jgi:poly(3-hydroxybutyrate) depolymerase
MRAAVLGGLLLSLLVQARAEAKIGIEKGKGEFVFVDEKGHPERPMRVFTYRPDACDTNCPIQFVIHGAGRDPKEYRDHWVKLAKRYKLIIVAPEFSEEYWPGKEKYNLGDVPDNPKNPEKWAYAVIEHLFDELRDGQSDYRIFGHSAGGQFVVRMLLLLPKSRASVYMAANPGWYTMPEWRKAKTDLAFPYTLVDSPSGEAEVRQALSRRLILFLGDEDTDPEDPHLNTDAGAMAQGENRFERGHNFFALARRSAGELGLPFTWELIEVPGVGHDGTGMSLAAAKALYGASRDGRPVCPP